MLVSLLLRILEHLLQNKTEVENTIFYLRSAGFEMVVIC